LDTVDITGQDPYGTPTYTWYSNWGDEEKKDAFILVYDITPRSSFEVIRRLFDPTEYSRNDIVTKSARSSGEKFHKRKQWN
jgi:hypothetical protein